MASESSPTNTPLPILIVGAGPVGFLLALHLAKNNIRSLIIEKNGDIDSSPRAVAYYPVVLEAFKSAGIYDLVLECGFCMGGMLWRKPLSYDAHGNPSLGETVASFLVGERGADGTFPEGKFSVNCVQGKLVRLMLEEVEKNSLVTLLFNTELTAIDQDSDGVIARVETLTEPQSITAQYLAACDGGRSTVRKLLGISFTGFSWPETLLAMDVMRDVDELPDPPAYFQVDRTHWGVVVPLEIPRVGERSLWRYNVPIPDNTLTDEEALDSGYVDSLLLKYIEGPRPSTHKVVRKRLYRMQQLLASTMHRGRVVFAGDSAHLNNPIGGLGLCTGLLDADLLAQALVLILSRQYPNPQDLLEEYSAARRHAFATVTNPFSVANKSRLHEADVDDLVREDWFFRALRKGDQQELGKFLEPMTRYWRTDLRSIINDQDYLHREHIL